MHNRHWALGAAALVVCAACGTSLPSRDFSGLEGNSGSAATAAQGPDSGQPGTGPESSNGPNNSADQSNTAAGPTGGGPSSDPTGPGSKHDGQTQPTAAATTSSAPSGGCGGGKNTASDTGVTPTSIKVGVLYTGPNNPFAPNQFVVSYDGVRAYFGSLDRDGGVCGRTVQVDACDDSGDRNRDISCAHKLIDQDKVFAIVGSDVYQYAAAQYVSQSKVPDIGGQPVTGSAYYTYPYLYSILGSLYANDGHAPSTYWGAAGLGDIFKKKLHLSRVGVVHYAQTDSTRGARYLEQTLQAAGVKVDDESIPLAGDSASQVNDMSSHHDQAVFNALDINGNLNLCRAMQNSGMDVPVIGTISVWNQEVGKDLSRYKCLSKFYSWGGSTNYANTSDPWVKQFRTSYSQFAPDAPLAEWSLQGWAAGLWFVDAAKSCGAALTRACVEKYVDTPKGYGGHGLLDAHTVAFTHHKTKPAKVPQCFEVVKWNGGASGTWSTVTSHHNTCYNSATLSYPA